MPSVVDAVLASHCIVSSRRPCCHHRDFTQRNWICVNSVSLGAPLCASFWAHLRRKKKQKYLNGRICKSYSGRAWCTTFLRVMIYGSCVAPRHCSKGVITDICLEWPSMLPSLFQDIEGESDGLDLEQDTARSRRKSRRRKWDARFTWSRSRSLNAPKYHWGGWCSNLPHVISIFHVPAGSIGATPVHLMMFDRWTFDFMGGVLLFLCFPSRSAGTGFSWWHCPDRAKSSIHHR